MSSQSVLSKPILHTDLLGAYNPEAVIAVGDAGTRTLREFRQHVTAVAAHIPPADSADPRDILVTCQDRYHLAVVLLAAWQQRRVIALPPNAREQTLQELAGRCALWLHDGPTHAVHDAIGDAAQHDVKHWLDAAPNSGLETLAPYPALQLEQPVVTIYTSGSTGTPTACRKTVAQLIGEGETLQRTFQLAADSCILATVPAHHIYGLLFSILLPLAAGAHFVRETPLLTPVIEETARRYHATALISVPPHLRVLAESDLTTLGHVRQVFSSGAPLADATAHALQRRFEVAVVEVLGSTETGGFAHRRADIDGARFRPFPNVTITTDSDQQLLLSSPLLEARLTQPITCPDRIELQSDGSFKHLGRIDGVVKVGGTRVSLPELEARVRGLQGVRDVAALAVDAGSARGQEIWLVIATERGQELPELRSELLRYYEPVLLPRRFRYVDVLPREATGKLMRARLFELFRSPKSETMQP